MTSKHAAKAETYFYCGTLIIKLYRDDVASFDVEAGKVIVVAVIL